MKTIPVARCTFFQTAGEAGHHCESRFSPQIASDTESLLKANVSAHHIHENALERGSKFWMQWFDICLVR